MKYYRRIADPIPMESIRLSEEEFNKRFDALVDEAFRAFDKLSRHDGLFGYTKRGVIAGENLSDWLSACVVVLDHGVVIKAHNEWTGKEVGTSVEWIMEDPSELYTFKSWIKANLSKD